MQAANHLQKALRKGGSSFGAWQMLPGAYHSRSIARTGVDWVCVDTEHGNIDDAQMHEAVAAIAGCGVSPLVRIAADEGWMVKRALDSGAHGIIVPLLRTPDDARRIVSAAKFPPQGIRGFGSPFAMGCFNNVSMEQYLQQSNDALLTIVQIETKDALENVDQIAAVKGVDVLLVGPFDLGNSIGKPIIGNNIDPELSEAIERIHSAAKANDKQTGIYCTSGEQAREYADRGFHMISISSDVTAIPSFFGSTLKTAKGGVAHAALNIAKGVVGSGSK